MEGIDTRLVYGFLDAGKTTYIQDTIRNDLFYKRGSTLILCFEQGEEEYDSGLMAEKNTSVAYFNVESRGNREADADPGGGKSCADPGDGKSAAEFCLESIEAYRPDRIYVEMNIMMPGLREQLPGCMRVTFAAALVDWATMPLYYINFMQMMKEMVADSHQVIFRGCPSSELLAPYGQAFRLMNPKASYLRQDPMGYHEKAFGLFLPYSLDESGITITEETYLPFWLDALDHPEHYDGKVIHFADPVEIRQEDSSLPALGRVVMTCCMADLQFMSFELDDALENVRRPGETDKTDDDGLPAQGWVTLEAYAEVRSGAFGQ